ncbi:MAG: hypothetical protein Q7S04_03675 [Candidatus Moranbacteria bacterium]|nr:hypothetical protein [Candidatus Moranbacteria bacterium]
MGLTSSNLKFILKKSKKYAFTGPLLTFGNQDIYATAENIRRWAKEDDILLSQPEKILLSTSGDVPTINKEAKEYIHAKTFFEFLGIREADYYDIDKFDFDRPKIIHDLQYPVDAKYHDFFNLIVDSGTLEHIFDVRAVMENTVKMTKVGGYVLQFIPAQNFLNHGFYQFSPTFFYDFFTANGFEIVESYLIEVRGRSDRYHSYDQEKDYTGVFFNPRNRLVNCFLSRKVKKVDHIELPDQFFYKKLAEDTKKVAQDFRKSGFDKVSTYFRSLIPIRFHGLFFGLYTFLKRMSSKRKYIDIRK